jgi:hypothetical protein
MVDSDGQFEYSPVKTIQFENGGTGFLAWPNPTSGSLSLRPVFPAGDGLELVLMDIAGKFILRQPIDFQQNETVVLEKWQLPVAGYYVLKIMENGKPIWQEKLLVTGH